jgi:hypothetical protein
MTRYAWLVLVLASCTPIGVATRPSSAPVERASPPPPKPQPAAPAPVAARPALHPAAEDIAYYRQISQVLADKKLEVAKATDFARFRRGSMLIRHAADQPAAGMELREAMKAEDLAAVHKAATAMVAEDAAHIGAHIILMNLDEKDGHKAEAELHDAFVAGMFHSILASGDGRAYGSAFVVYFVREEYDLVRALGGQVQGQSLGHEGAKSFDILHVKTKSGTDRDVYFDITELFAEEGKRFGLDK